MGFLTLFCDFSQSLGIKVHPAEAAMLFRPSSDPSLQQGKLSTIKGRSHVVGLDGRAFESHEVAFVIPDDEAQAAAIVAAGYRIHTPMSMHLGDGATAL